MKILFRLTLLVACLVVSLLRARADDPSPAFVLPTKEPALTLLLPDGLKVQKVSQAVSKALLAEGWEGLNWEGDVTIAKTDESRINLKVYAVALSSEVKLYFKASSEKKVAEDRIKKVALKALRGLEKATAVALDLEFRAAKGDGTVDTASAK